MLVAETVEFFNKAAALVRVASETWVTCESLTNATVRVLLAIRTEFTMALFTMSLTGLSVTMLMVLAALFLNKVTVLLSLAIFTAVAKAFLNRVAVRELKAN